MAIIKQRIKIKELRKPFKIPVDVLAELELYAEFLNEDKDFIATEGLRACFKSDNSFREFIAKPEQQYKLAQLQANLTRPILKPGPNKRRGRPALVQPVA